MPLHTFLGGFSFTPGEVPKKPKEVKLRETNNTRKLSNKRKPERRSKAKNKNHNVDIKIIHSNTDGYKSKKESINEIADKETPDIMTLNDTNLKGNLKV